MRQAVVGNIGARAVLQAFETLGLDPKRIAAEAAVDAKAIDDADGVIPAAAFYRLWESAQSQWKKPGLGLMAGMAAPRGAYEVLEYLLTTSSTLSEGMHAFARYFQLATRTARYEATESQDEAACAMVWRIPPQGIMFHLRDYSLAVVTLRIRHAAGVAPLRVELDGPPLAPEREYRRAFGSAVILHAPRNALVFTPAQWNAPLANRDPSLHRMLRRHADLLLERGARGNAESWEQRTRAELLHRLRDGLPSLTAIASSCGVSTRTLQRLLREEGIAFRELAEDVRGGLAREYLADPALSVNDIAFLTGYADASAFSHAFRRWTGKSPEAFRRTSARQRPPRGTDD